MRENIMTADREKTALTFNPDRAIKMPEEDKLGRAAFAENIATKILNYENECPLVLGVYGSWGYGKTSLINLVKYYIIRAQQNNALKAIEMFDLSPWSYSHSDQIIEPFIKEIADKFSTKAIELEAAHKEYHSVFSNISVQLNLIAATLNTSNNTELTALANLITLGLAAKDWGIHFFPKKREPNISSERKPKSLAEVKETITKLLSEKKDFKIILVVDDIDRLLADEIRQLFQAIKSIINLPNLIFILAMDDREVGKLISYEGFSGRDYIEKIIQIPIYLPYPDRNKFEDCLLSKINIIATFNSDARWNNDRWFSIYHGGLAEIFLENANLRQLYRMINQICINLERMHIEVNPIDYIAIETIKIYYPNAYRFIYRNKNLFLGNELNLKESISNELSGKTEKELILKEFNDFKPQIKSLLKLLFPQFRISSDETNDFGGYDSSWQKEQRICSGHYFENYYLQEIPADQVSQADINYFLDENHRHDEYLNRLKQLVPEKCFNNFLVRLDANLDYKNIWVGQDMFLSLADISEFYDHRRLLNLESVDIFIGSMIIKYLDVHDKDRAFLIFDDIMYRSTSIYMILLIILKIEKDNPSKIINGGQWSEETLYNCKKGWLAKVEAAYINKTLKTLKGLRSILYYWNKWCENDHVELFVDELDTSRAIINLLQDYIYDNGSKFNIKELFELNIAFKLYMKPSLNLLDNLNTDEKSILQQFKRSYEQFIGTDEFKKFKK
jgi:predicted KAP-like P-loop ATPase